MSSRNRFSICLAAGMLALSLAPCILAADPPEGNTNKVDSRPGSVAAPLPEAKESRLELSLEDVLRLALSRNLDLEVTRIGHAESSFRILEAEAVFDPNLSASFDKSSSESPASNSLESTDSANQRWSLGVNQVLLPGTAWNLAWSNNEAESNSPVASVNPSYSSGMTLSVTQPLLRGFGAGVNGLGIALAGNARESSRASLIQAIQRTVVDVENAYWDVLALREALQVGEQSLDVARDLLRITRIRVDVGTLAPIEVVSAESGVATREEAIIRRRALLENAEDQLRRIINVPTERWGEPLTLTTRPVVGDLPEFGEKELEAAFRVALEMRPEMAQSRLDLDSKRMQAAYDSNATLPKLDLVGTYGYAGLSGDRRCTVFDEGCVPGQALEKGGWSDAFDQVTGRDFNNWSLGMRLSVPIFNRAERARATVSRLEVERSRATMASLEQQVKLDVRLTGRDVVTSHKTIYAAEKARILSERNLDASRKKYENGIGTNFEILQIEEELAQARLSEVQARLSYQKALASFHRARGDLLEARNIAILEEESAMCGIWTCCGASCWVDGLSRDSKETK